MINGKVMKLNWKKFKSKSKSEKEKEKKEENSIINRFDFLPGIINTKY